MQKKLKFWKLFLLFKSGSSSMIHFLYPFLIILLTNHYSIFVSINSIFRRTYHLYLKSEIVSQLLFPIKSLQKILNKKYRMQIRILLNFFLYQLNDFFFGIHSLLGILRGFHILNLNISKRSGPKTFLFHHRNNSA